MKINLNDLTFKDGKYTYTFTPDRDMQLIELESDCFGDLAINHLQVERNPNATYFVPPEVYEGNLSGIFNNLKEINAEMTDEENSDLWSRIRINVGGMMREYHHDHISTEIVETANGIGIRIGDVEKNLKNEIAATAEALQIKLSSTDNKVTQLAATANGIQTSVRDLKLDTESSFNLLKGLIDLKVTQSDVEGIIRNSGDSIYLAVKDKIPDSKMTASEIKSALNLSRDGVRIQGKNIMLDGNSYISSGVIKNAHIGSLDASKITTGELNAAIVRAIHLDVGNLTGDISNFIQSNWNAINGRISINGNGLTARHTDGSYTVLNASGLYTQIGGTNYQTHYLHDTFNIPEVCNDTRGGSRASEIGLNPEPYYWYQLPSIYRGKRFRALASLSDTLTFNSPNYTAGNMRILRTVCYVKQDSIDYTNARVPIVGYAHVRNIGYGYNYNYPVSVNLFVNY